jgi:hypothetical protein
VSGDKGKARPRGRALPLRGMLMPCRRNLNKQNQLITLSNSNLLLKMAAQSSGEFLPNQVSSAFTARF